MPPWAGGKKNRASGDRATVGGGTTNQASAQYATVAGGYQNQASGDAATVGGGLGNQASGDTATVIGGRDNTTAGDYSVAAGHQAKANHRGAFVWADASSMVDFSSERNNQFRVRAAGGARFDVNSSRWVNIWDDGTNVISTSTGARLTTGGAWTDNSDRASKAHFAAVEGRDVLARLAGVVCHHLELHGRGGGHPPGMGPVAQDFFTRLAWGIATAPSPPWTRMG